MYNTHRPFDGYVYTVCVMLLQAYVIHVHTHDQQTYEQQALLVVVQPETGASQGPPHKGLVEELVEKAKEYLPHQLTGAEPHPTHAGDVYNASAGGPYAGSTGSAYPAFSPTYTRVSALSLLLGLEVDRHCSTVQILVCVWFCPSH